MIIELREKDLRGIMRLIDSAKTRDLYGCKIGDTITFTVRNVVEIYKCKSMHKIPLSRNFEFISRTGTNVCLKCATPVYRPGNEYCMSCTDSRRVKRDFELR